MEQFKAVYQNIHESFFSLGIIKIFRFLDVFVSQIMPDKIICNMSGFAEFVTFNMIVTLRIVSSSLTIIGRPWLFGSTLSSPIFINMYRDIFQILLANFLPINIVSSPNFMSCMPVV